MQSHSFSMFLVVFYTYVLPFVILAVAYSIWRVGINTFEISKSLKQIVDLLNRDNKKSDFDRED